MRSTITKGELIALLANVSDDIPLFAWNPRTEQWFNLHLTADDVTQAMNDAEIGLEDLGMPLDLSDHEPDDTHS